MTSELEHARLLLSHEYGLQFGSSLEPRLASAVHGLPRVAFASERIWLDSLLELVTIQESYVLRHPEQLEAVARRVPGFGRVWSGACARGEEALSLAIVLEGHPSVEILASDVSEHALATARSGHLRRRSLRGLDAATLRRFFVAFEGGYLARRELTSRIRYERLNLAQLSAPWPQAIDVVLLRNVLFYFTDPQIETVLERVRRILRPDGMLVVAPAESGIVATRGWSSAPGMPTGCVSPPGSLTPSLDPPPPAVEHDIVPMKTPSRPPPVVLVEPKDATAALARRLVREAAQRDV
jgi:chemotaxis protein methyltransferase CheR